MGQEQSYLSTWAADLVEAGGTLGMEEWLAGEEGKASCHSDYVDPDSAKKIQSENLVQLNTAPAHNIPTHDPLI